MDLEFDLITLGLITKHIYKCVQCDVSCGGSDGAAVMMMVTLVLVVKIIMLV